MGILDTIRDLNPFKKKEEFAFAPLDENNFNQDSSFNEQNLNQGLDSTPNFSQNNFNGVQQTFEQNDPRMRMPLGENLRQERFNLNEINHEPYEKNNPLQKDLDLISAKLDYLKVSLESINQRLVNLEHIAKQELEKNNYIYQKRNL